MTDLRGGVIETSCLLLVEDGGFIVEVEVNLGAILKCLIIYLLLKIVENIPRIN